MALSLNNPLISAARLARNMSVWSRTLFKMGLPDANRPELLREAFEELGTTYIKLGQFIASAPSLFPGSYVTEFTRLLDRVQPLPYREVEPALISAWGADYRKLFRSIDEVPLASASIAQVHAATLEDGRDVVLKILKPNTLSIIATDMGFLNTILSTLETIIPGSRMLSMKGIFEDMAKAMADECDFTLEHQNITDFLRFLDAAGIDGVVAPNVIRELSSSEILVMDRLYGTPLREMSDLLSISKDPSGIILKAMDTWMKSLTMAASFHADLHAGNLMLLENGNLAFLDFGIVGRIRPETWEAVSSLAAGIMTRDPELTGNSMVQIGMTGLQEAGQDLVSRLQKFFQDMDELESGDVSAAGLDNIMLNLSSLARESGLRFPREFGLLLKTMLYFDRYFRQLVPDGDAWSAAFLPPQ